MEEAAVEEGQTFAPIRELFQDRSLRDRLEKAKSEEEALGILVSAGARNNVDFSAEGLQRLVEVFGTPERKPPKDVGDMPGEMRADTHVHMSCCTDCPPSGALCC
jgi:hypothetical protein